MNLDNLKVDIYNVVSRADGDAINKSYAIYSRIIMASSMEDQVDLFKFACENYGTIQSTNENKLPTLIDKEEKTILVKNLGKFVNGILDALLRMNLTEKEFYLSLWKQISSKSFILSDEKKKVFALYYILIDNRIPYFQLGESIVMSDEEYSALYDQLTTDLNKIRFILYSPLEQKTEQAGHLLTVLDEYEDKPKERAILMAFVIGITKKMSELSTSRKRHLSEELSEDELR